ncbi:MAG: glutamate-1-semialdehyde 2,1-aminomutase [Patescibacteria group bacterium]
MSTTSDLLSKRHALIPGAAHTYSKGDDQFPSVAPLAILRGKGAYVWGVDDVQYLDWCMGLRSVSLGHVNEEVNAAVAKQMEFGTNFGRPHMGEYEFADRLTSLLPNVEMVKFAKNGSTVTTAATKLARAHTGRKYIVCCVDHPFFSYDDWFIGTTPADAGIPQEIKDLTLTFKYNDLDSLKALFDARPGEIACVIMEVVTTTEPVPGFLEGVRELCTKEGTVLIFDEMITGFRFDLLGAAKKYGVAPDLVTYGKGIANGYSMAVLGGKKEIMERGGLQHDKERVFLISTTHGAEAISIAAAMAAINIMERDHVSEALWERGKILADGLTALSEKHGLTGIVDTVGFAPNLSLAIKNKEGQVDPVLRTLFLQEVIKREVLFQGYFALSFSHTQVEIDRTLEVFDEVMGFYKNVLEEGNARELLIGEPCKPVFRKYN